MKEAKIKYISNTSNILTSFYDWMLDSGSFAALLNSSSTSQIEFEFEN